MRGSGTGLAALTFWLHAVGPLLLAQVSAETFKRAVGVLLVGYCAVKLIGRFRVRRRRVDDGRVGKAGIDRPAWHGRRSLVRPPDLQLTWRRSMRSDRLGITVAVRCRLGRQ